MTDRAELIELCKIAQHLGGPQNLSAVGIGRYLRLCSPEVVLALFEENEQFKTIAEQPASLNASPAAEYEGLKRQFFALRNYALCKDKLAGYYSRELESMQRVDRSLSAGEIDAERNINEQLTNDLLCAEALIETLRKDAERYRWTSTDGNWVARMFGKWRAHIGAYGDASPTEWYSSREEAIDAAMSKEKQL